MTKKPPLRPIRFQPGDRVVVVDTVVRHHIGKEATVIKKQHAMWEIAFDDGRTYCAWADGLALYRRAPRK